MKNADVDILPGDKVELRLVCHVKEVQLTDDERYVLTLVGEEGPPYALYLLNQGGSIAIDMRKDGNAAYVKKI